MDRKRESNRLEAVYQFLRDTAYIYTYRVLKYCRGNNTRECKVRYVDLFDLLYVLGQLSKWYYIAWRILSQIHLRISR